MTTRQDNERHHLGSTDVTTIGFALFGISVLLLPTLLVRLFPESFRGQLSALPVLLLAFLLSLLASITGLVVGVRRLPRRRVADRVGIALNAGLLMMWLLHMLANALR